jgi:hypothetical protein
MGLMSRRGRSAAFVFSLSGLLLAPPVLLAQAKSLFATRVVAFDTRNQAGGGIFVPANALGAPDGTDPLAVHSLGVGGWLTLGFDVVITDGPGADFIVFENSFAVQGRLFAEVMQVEVSSDGNEWAQFASAYQGAQTSHPFATSHAGVFRGLAGVKPTRAAPTLPAVDPRDVVEAGGDAFDLADLAGHPQVLNRKVDLAAIRFVRLVDVVAGTTLDSRNIPIQDPTAGSADVDAVAVIHAVSTVSNRGPRVELAIARSGDFELRVSDPDGLADIDPATLRAALDADPLPVAVLLSLMQPTAWSNTSITLRLGAGLPPGFWFQLSFSVKDRAGHRSGLTRTRPDF